MSVRSISEIFFLLVVFVGVQTDQVHLPTLLQNLDVHDLLENMIQLEVKSNCTEDLKKYNESLLNQQWAQMMFDSSAKIPVGVIGGNFKILGQFDECIGVEDPSISFTGQYCFLNLNFDQSFRTVKTSKRESPFEPLMGPTYFPVAFSYAICVPSSCSAEEIESGFNQILSKTNITVQLDPLNCRTKEPRTMGSGEWVVIGFLIVMGVIAVCSTIYDVFQRELNKNDKPHPILSSFSIYTNGKRLFAITDGAGQLNCLHGMRALSMAWVVLCHSYITTMTMGPISNLSSTGEFLSDLHHIVVSNGFVAVDTFFFLSGLLVCFVFFRDIAKSGTYDFPLSYIHRYIRLTPPFALMILLQATIVTYLGDGPMWHFTVDSSKDVCVENWWSGLLYVQNFVAPLSSCLGQSWYLSADMQMYWVSPLVLYPLLIWPVVAPAYLGLLVLGAAFANFAVGYVENLGPSFLITKSPNQMSYDYTQFYTRMSPWLIGVALGYLLCGIRAKKISIKLTPWQILCGWFLSAGLCLGSIYGVAGFLDPKLDFHYTRVEAAFYLAFNRVGWGLGLAWVVFACVQGYGGVINKFLSWGIFQPLGKLSYCTFLIHMTIQNYRNGSARTNIYFRDLEMVYFFLGDWVLANLLSIPVTLIFEMPFFNVERYLFRKVKILPIPRPKKAKKTGEELGKNNPNFVNSS